jgi:hypothetical protein
MIPSIAVAISAILFSLVDSLKNDSDMGSV